MTAKSFDKHAKLLPTPFTPNLELMREIAAMPPAPLMPSILNPPRSSRDVPPHVTAWIARQKAQRELRLAECEATARAREQRRRLMAEDRQIASMSVDEFLATLPDVARQSESDAAFRLYVIVDGMRERGEYAKCDAMLGAIDIDGMPDACLYAFVSITRDDAGRIPSRETFLARVRPRLEAIEGMAEFIR